MESIVKPIQNGTIIEVISVDRSCIMQQDSVKVGNHYTVVDNSDFKYSVSVLDNGVISILDLKSIRIVQTVQKSHVHYIGSGFCFFKKGYHYETEELVHDQYYVGGIIRIPPKYADGASNMSISVLECEISGFTINNTGDL